MLKSLSDENHRTICKNLEYLAGFLVTDDSSKFRRRFNPHSKERDVEYRRQGAASKWNILRTEPELCTLLKAMHNGTVDHKLYPYVEQPKEQKSKKDDIKKAQKGAKLLTATADAASALENPRLFVYTIGGLSHHEICQAAVL